MAKLVIYEALEGQETIFEDFELTTHRVVVGSSEDNNLVLDIPNIDPTHASLELRNDHWVIQDLGGPGGTVLNGQQIDGPHQLQHNDLIELHTIKIRFYEEDVIFDEDEITAVVDADIFKEEEEQEIEVRGRVWFGTIAGITLAIIFAIILAFVVADYLGLLKISDLLSF